VSDDGNDVGGSGITDGPNVETGSEKDNEILVLENTVEKCLICLDEYEAEEQVQILACKHMFHKPCVDQWLVKCAASCPVCRRKAVH